VYQPTLFFVINFCYHITIATENRKLHVCLLTGLPLLFGVCLIGHPFLMITQFHGIDGRCVTLVSALKKTLWKKQSEWARMFKEIVDALYYVHGKGFLHNDFKGDNVILAQHSVTYHPIIIDFGKSRRIQDAKHYCLSQKEKEKYRQRYWHIAPELINGTHKQSTKSDIFSLGVLMTNVCKCHKYEQLSGLAKECTNDNPIERPTLVDIGLKLSQYNLMTH
jgi:serine/threonine protein kinase